MVNVSPPFVRSTYFSLLQERKPRVPVVNPLVQKIWPSILDKFKIQEDSIIFDWSNLQVGSALHTLSTEALEFGERALAWGTFARGDYRKLCELFVYYLDGPGSVPNFMFHQPGACHEARFMADSLYLLTLQMTQKISNIMNLE